MPHPEFLSGQRGYAEDVTSLAIRGSYTPELTATNTDPDLGVLGVADGQFYVTGALVHVEFSFIFAAGADPGDGQYLISTPEDYPIDTLAVRTAIGVVRLRDDSTLDQVFEFVTVQDSTPSSTVRMQFIDGTSVADDQPWIWAAGDSLRGSFTYLTPE